MVRNLLLSREVLCYLLFASPEETLNVYEWLDRSGATASQKTCVKKYSRNVSPID